MLVLTFPEADVPSALRVQVLALQERAWPLSGVAPGHDPALASVSMLLVDEGRVLSALSILSKEIVHAGERWAASGLSAVVTDEAVRRRGHGLRLVEAARGRIAESGADLGLFTCDRPLRGLYERAGWRVLAGTVLVGGTPAEPFPSDLFDKVTLAAFFSTRARRRAPLFEHSRIELFPGTIDRLW
jgi:aminoglycoside 2'-N-acetyltransferase I